MLVRLSDVSKSFGSLDVLKNVTLAVNPGEKLGLIGSNGAGKTTILELIRHPEQADAGSIERRSSIRIGHLDQIPDFGGQTVLDEALQSFDSVRTTEERLRKIEATMAESEDPALLAEYSSLLDRLESQDGYTYRARTEAALLGVGFKSSQFRRPAGSLSGGEQSRLALVRLLLSDFDLLLLDEPTNHLDIRSISWLESCIQGTATSVLLVSHDRYFLDRTVTRILELEAGRLSVFAGNYSFYLEARTERRRSEETAWERQQEWIDRTEDYIRRNIAGQKSKQAQSRRKALARLDRVERPAPRADSPRFRFAPAEAGGRYVLSTRGLGAGYGREWIVRDVNLDIERGERWALVGPNGSGKTTLLRSLTGHLDPMDGDLILDEGATVGYYDQQLDDLDPGNTVLEELRSLDSRTTDQALRSFLASLLFRGEAVFQKVRNLSGGERSRLTLAKIIYTQPSVLALDEPTNHLDIASREALEEALLACPATLLFVTHDRRLVERLATHILYLGSEGVRVFDRFEGFEEWLARDLDTSTVLAASTETRDKPPKRTSKNRQRATLERIADLEARIETCEREIKEIETLFQKPPVDLAWESTQRRHRELLENVEALYGELADLDGLA